MTKANIAPGINRTSTKAEATGGWWDCNNVRFQYGKPESIKGWRSYSQTTPISLNGMGRKQHIWRDLSGRLYYMVGTEQKLYIIYKDIAYDITPIETVVPFGSVTSFATTTGTNTLTITTAANHDRSVGDWITTEGIVTTSTNLGNVPDSTYNNSDGEGWRVIAVPSATSFTIQLSVSVLTDSEAITAGNVYYQLKSSKYNITNGGVGGGWGSGSWGSGPWGGAASTSYNVANAFRLWSVENRGEDLIVSPTFGGIYIWSITDCVSSTTGIPNATITRRAVTLKAYALAHGGVVSVDVPENNTYVISSTGDGRLISFGCNQFKPNRPAPPDPLSGPGDFTKALIRWSDNDLNDKDIFDWGPRSTNTAGGQVLEKGSSIEAVIETSREKLIWTDTTLYSMTNIGGPNVYAFNAIGDNISIASPRAAVSVGNAVYFMGDNAFYIYQGSVELLPSTIDNYIWDNINKLQLGKVYAVADESFGEIVWHYCSADSNEIDRYVVYNRAESTWYFGSYDTTSIPINMPSPAITYTNTKNRTSWLHSGILDKPTATYIKSFDPTVIPTSVVSSVFVHEEDYDGDGVAMESFVESGDLVIGDLEDTLFIDSLVPDFLYYGTPPVVAGYGVQLSITSRRYPHTTEVQESIVEALSTTGKLDTRARGKLFDIRISAVSSSFQWKLGNLFFNGIQDGKRP